IFRLDALNGQEYDRRAVTKVHLRGEKDVNLPRVMKKALYKAMDDYPEADYYMPVYVKTERERMFLGRYVTRKALIRAYRIRKVEVSGEVSEEIIEEVSGEVPAE
ncbi:MAG: hypothetical protein LUC18_04930, partial [Porphyromonadaceae bacterium]|nr:hypothetical protein [Porphyromonadaceae bacterium]